MSFDAFGRRRNPSNWTYNNVPATYKFDRGYTGHEQLDQFGLINMNGRIYDPVLGRFLSPDIVVQDPAFTQSYNRYSYVVNNPLKYVDPSGYYRMHDIYGNGYDIDVSNTQSIISYMASDGRGGGGGGGGGGSTGYHYNWSTGFYEDSPGNRTSFETALYTDLIIYGGSLELIDGGKKNENFKKVLTIYNGTYTANRSRSTSIDLVSFNGTAGDYFFQYNPFTKKFYLPYWDLEVNPIN